MLDMKRYSLNIGLNYEGTPYALPDCEMDAETMNGIAENCAYSGEAKRVNWYPVSAFETDVTKIAMQTKPTDETIISFSGHGTQWQEAGEKDGLTEGLCFWGADGIQVLKDDDFKKLIDMIPGTKYVVLDSCFSGGMARSLRGRIKLSGEWRGKQIAFDPAFEVVKPDFNFIARNTIRTSKGKSYYLLACSEGEVSWSTGSGGLFTNTFAAIFARESKKGRSIVNLMNQTAKICKPDQTPTWEIYGGTAIKRVF